LSNKMKKYQSFKAMIEKEKRKKRKEKQGCTEGLYIYYGK
jgi:hypothetical protein